MNDFYKNFYKIKLNFTSGNEGTGDKSQDNPENQKKEFKNSALDEYKNKLDEIAKNIEEIKGKGNNTEKVNEFESRLNNLKSKEEELKNLLKDSQYKEEIIERIVNPDGLKDKLEKKGDPKDKEYDQIKGTVDIKTKNRDDLLKEENENWQKISKIINEMKEIEKDVEEFKRNEEVMKENKLNEEELKKMKDITNNEFLNIPPNERLRFVTKGNINASDVKEGGVQSLEFTFTYDGKYNKELYINTTAGQVINKEVRQVESNGILYERKGISGEFFAENGVRLKIDEGTVVNIKKFSKEEELKKFDEDAEKKLGEYKGTKFEQLAITSIEKGYDPKFVVNVFKDKIKDGFNQNDIENLLTDVARTQNNFSLDFPQEKVSNEDGSPTEKFAGYILNTFNQDNFEDVSKTFGYNIENMKLSRRTNNPSLGGGPLNMEAINIEGVSKEEVDRILKLKKFTPGSKEAQILFTSACKASNLPPEWGKCNELHQILKRESGGEVGRLNYTIKGMSNENFKQKALSSGVKNPIGSTSTASGLGQLLLQNVDRYYPDGRNGIGDPINEAAGMLRYIKERYGNPQVAWSVYGKLASYTHGVTGERKKKGHKEGY